MYLITYTGDGATTEFNFLFPYFQSADVHVSVNSVPKKGARLNNIFPITIPFKCQDIVSCLY